MACYGQILAVLLRIYAVFGVPLQGWIMRWCTKINKYQVANTWCQHKQFSIETLHSPSKSRRKTKSNECTHCEFASIQKSDLKKWLEKLSRDSSSNMRNDILICIMSSCYEWHHWGVWPLLCILRCIFVRPPPFVEDCWDFSVCFVINYSYLMNILWKLKMVISCPHGRGTLR